MNGLADRDQLVILLCKSATKVIELEKKMLKSVLEWLIHSIHSNCSDEIWEKLVVLVMDIKIRAQGADQEEFRLWTKRVGSGLEPTHE